MRYNMGKSSRKRQPPQRTEPLPDPELSFLPAPSIRDDIEDNLLKIYESFYQEFNKRINERKSCADPLNIHSLQRSVLDKKVKDKLVERVKVLAKAVGRGNVYGLFQAKTSDFICRVLETVRATTDKRLALGLLEDAYDVMENAIEVVEELIQVYPADNIQRIMRAGRSEFYDLVLQDDQLKELLERGGAMEPPRDQLIYETFEQEDEEAEYEFQRSLAQQELIQRMSLEELVTYINDTPKARRSKHSGTSTADCSKSPSRPEALSESDQEVESFRECLENCSPARRKVVPKVSDEWLRRLHIRAKS